MAKALATVLGHRVAQTGRQPQLSNVARQEPDRAALTPVTGRQASKQASILLKLLLFWASSEMECLLTNPEGQSAKLAQMSPSARQDAILVSCKEVSSLRNAGSTLGSLPAGLHTHW